MRTVWLRNGPHGWEWTSSLTPRFIHWRGPYKTVADAKAASLRNMVFGAGMKREAAFVLVVEDREE